jgi:hypothetical protein
MNIEEKLRAVLRENKDGHLSLHECMVIRDAIQSIEASKLSATEFFVVMQKRGDGKIYPDLHKTDERLYLLEEDATVALEEKGDLSKHFHKIRMVGVLADEWGSARA